MIKTLIKMLVTLSQSASIRLRTDQLEHEPHGPLAHFPGRSLVPLLDMISSTMTVPTSMFRMLNRECRRGGLPQCRGDPMSAGPKVEFHAQISIFFHHCSPLLSTVAIPAATRRRPPSCSRTDTGRLRVAHAVDFIAIGIGIVVGVPAALYYR